MKKIITLLIVVITALYFHSRTSKVAENGDLFEIRRALSGEQFGPFDTSEKLYIIVGIDYIPFELIELFREITGIKVVVDIFSEFGYVVFVKIFHARIGIDARRSQNLLRRGKADPVNIG